MTVWGLVFFEVEAFVEWFFTEKFRSQLKPFLDGFKDVLHSCDFLQVGLGPRPVGHAGGSEASLGGSCGEGRGIPLI